MVVEWEALRLFTGATLQRNFALPTRLPRTHASAGLGESAACSSTSTKNSALNGCLAIQQQIETSYANRFIKDRSFKSPVCSPRQMEPNAPESGNAAAAPVPKTLPAEAPPVIPEIGFQFEIHPSLRPWAHNPVIFLSRARMAMSLSTSAADSQIDGVATGAVVFNPQGRVLLVQRASHDSMPNRWEVPGGAVDWDDKSILHGAARELWEEAGLECTRIVRFIPEDTAEGIEQHNPVPYTQGYFFTNRTRTSRYVRFIFLAEVENCNRVALDPNEHQDYLWATEEEVREQRVGEKDIPLTAEATRLVVLKAFRIKREMEEGGNTA